MHIDYYYVYVVCTSGLRLEHYIQQPFAFKWSEGEISHGSLKWDDSNDSLGGLGNKKEVAPFAAFATTLDNNED